MADNPRPLIETKVLTEFGEVYEDESFLVTAGADHSYVPGYSDLRRERDSKIAAIHRKYGQRGSSSHEAARTKELRDITPLPVRLQWVRSSRVAGNEPDSTKPTQAGNDGYREVKKTDLGQQWLTAMPPGANTVAGGAIRKGDVTLMVCDAAKAARNAASIALQVQRQVDDTTSSPLMRNAGGADPFIESTLGEKPIGQ